MAWQNNDLRIRVIPEAQRIPCRSPALKLEIALTTALRESEVLGLKIEDLLAPTGEVRDKVRVKVKGGRRELVNLPALVRLGLMVRDPFWWSLVVGAVGLGVPGWVALVRMHLKGGRS